MESKEKFCHDCGVEEGGLHERGCDMEHCRKCGEQLLCCNHNINKLNKLSKENRLRANKVKNWLEKYAPKEYKFEVQSKIKIKLNKKEKLALKELKKSLKKKLTDKGLFDEFYRISDDVGISNKKFFKICYKIIINKETTKIPKIHSK